jgi:hypothetical protein
MRRLSETEQELKRQQDEKTLAEMKFKQQELEHDQHMRSLINRYLFFFLFKAFFLLLCT